MSEIKDKQNKRVDRDADVLFKAILKLKNLDETRRFFRDLLTKGEIMEFSQRLKVARMLTRRIRYTKIAEETGMSSTTIARVQKWLKNGTGGYKIALRRLK